MPDWKKIVREKLGSLPLTNGRRDEVIEELAQQLESAYEEALAQGIHEQEAMRGSLDQFKDWENLRNEVFQSVEGTHLPIWEQSGIFADFPTSYCCAVRDSNVSPGSDDHSHSGSQSLGMECQSFFRESAAPHRAIG
jgi:hypothetical protein